MPAWTGKLIPAAGTASLLPSRLQPADEAAAADLNLVSQVARRFSPAYVVSVVGDRRWPFVPPPGVIGVPCTGAEAFVAEWRSLR